MLFTYIRTLDTTYMDRIHAYHTPGNLGNLHLDLKHCMHEHNSGISQILAYLGYYIYEDNIGLA